jgi:hypothetical protein
MRKVYFKVIAISIVCIYYYSSNAQTTVLHCLKQNDIEKTDKETIKQFKKCNNSKTQEIKIVNILYLGYDGKFEKSDFLNKNFLNKIQPYYYYKRYLFFKKKRLHTNAYICNNDGKVLALTDTRSIMCRERFNDSIFMNYDILINKMKEQKYVYVFCIGPLGTYFCVDNNNMVFVIEDNMEGIKVFSLEDYINLNWDKFSN